MQIAAQGIPAHDDGQSHQHFQRVFVHSRQSAVADIAGRQPDEDAAACLYRKQPRTFGQREFGAADGSAQQNDEDDDAHTVVEQAFARHRALQGLRYVLFPEHTEYGHRIGRGDQGPEDEIPDGCDGQGKQQADAPHRQADEHGRDDHPHGRKQENRKPGDLQPVEIDMQCTGEEQEAQHPLQQRFGEIQLPQDVGHPVAQRNRGNEGIRNHQADGRQCAHHGQSDDMGQLDEMMVEPAQQGGSHDEDRGNVESGKRAAGVMHRACLACAGVEGKRRG